LVTRSRRLERLQSLQVLQAAIPQSILGGNALNAQVAAGKLLGWPAQCSLVVKMRQRTDDWP